LTKKLRAIHFSHDACEKISFCHEHRGPALESWLDAWRGHCVPDVSLSLSSTISRAFPRWDRTKLAFPCVDSNATETQGIFYIKVPKTASSTLAGITTRIAGRETIRKHKSICKTYEPMKHMKCFELNCSLRDKNNSFLWTVIRNPKDRAISHFGMFYNQSRVNATDEVFLDTLKNHGSFANNIQLRFLSPLTNPDLPIPSNYNELLSVLNSTISEYNFIGTYERFEISLVVLSMIVGVSVQDVLFPYLNSRCGSNEKPSWLTDVIEGYLDSEDWIYHENGDFMLYDAVNRSLDLTIEKLGKETVLKRLKDFRRLIQIGT